MAGEHQHEDSTNSGDTMSGSRVHDFGIVDETGDIFEFHWNTDTEGQCRLEMIVQTERGPRRSELATIPATLWDEVNSQAARELTAEMGDTERSKSPPSFKIGINRLSPLIGRELAVLLWALMEAGEKGNISAILHGWRELAREERWWLYAKAASPGQREGAGWRLALFHALSETPETRFADQAPQKKKSPGTGSRTTRKTTTKKKPVANPRPASRQQPASLIPMAATRRISPSPEPSTTSLMACEIKNPTENMAKRAPRKVLTNN